MRVPVLASTPLFVAAVALAAPGPIAEHTVGFAADPSINTQGIFDAAKSSWDWMATFPSSPHSGGNVKIFGDWRNLDGVSAMHYIADMDVDCDGVDFECHGNRDGQDRTSFGRLSATRVPFYVLPLRFRQDHASEIRPNSLGAIICDGRMFYGIFGDEDADHPQVIGEASILMAQTCFPNDRLDGGNGHAQVDVLYVVFGQDVPSGVGRETIDIRALKILGDRQARKLADALGV